MADIVVHKYNGSLKVSRLCCVCCLSFFISACLANAWMVIVLAHGIHAYHLLLHAESNRADWRAISVLLVSGAANGYEHVKFPTQAVCCATFLYCVAAQGEHGTGRNMAPFVELEWGSRAMGIMRRIKDMFDPHHLLNPGVILNEVC